MPDDTYVYVGRPRAGAPIGLGNPFPRTSERTREQAVHAFATYAQEAWRDRTSPLRRQVLDLVERVERGEDIKLVCWCHPKACHADILAGLVSHLVADRRVRLSAHDGTERTTDGAEDAPASSSLTPVRSVRLPTEHGGATAPLTPPRADETGVYTPRGPG